MVLRALRLRLGLCLPLLLTGLRGLLRAIALTCLLLRGLLISIALTALRLRALSVAIALSAL